MYKKFLENMVIEAVEQEFGFVCACTVRNIKLYDDSDFNTWIKFSFESVADTGIVFGFLNVNGKHDFIKCMDSYKSLKAYYNN